MGGSGDRARSAEPRARRYPAQSLLGSETPEIQEGQVHLVEVAACAQRADLVGHDGIVSDLQRELEVAQDTSDEGEPLLGAPRRAFGEDSSPAASRRSRASLAKVGVDL